MNPCNNLIRDLYQNPKVNELLNKINPAELRDDLRQELALVLLDYDCDRLQQMDAEGTLVSFTRRVMWKMATLPNGNFIRKFRKPDTLPLPDGDAIPAPCERNKDEAAEIIRVELSRKMARNPNEAHEAMIFEKYTELLSCEKVAAFFGVPRLHVFRVVKTVKLQIKNKLTK
jgi:hypothetical protein